MTPLDIGVGREQDMDNYTSKIIRDVSLNMEGIISRATQDRRVRSQTQLFSL